MRSRHSSGAAGSHSALHHCFLDYAGVLRQFGEYAPNQLERASTAHKLIRYRRSKSGCAGCERVVEAPAAGRRFERALPNPGLHPLGIGIQI